MRKRMTHAEKMQCFDRAGLYLVTSGAFSGGRGTLSIVTAALAGGVRLIQLREKELPLREFIRLARDVRRLTDAADALLIVNDRLDVALAVGADGVHLGQEDLPADLARQIAPDLIIGVSTHAVAEARAAEAAGASYINIGPIFATSTKKWNSSFLGVEGLQRIARAVSIPFTVMGGITKERLPELVRSGAHTVAVVTAVTAAADPGQAARELLAELARAHVGCVPPAAPASPEAVPRRQAKRILPVALLVEGRGCLVVGGGAVAARKALALVEAGAEVSLVAPELCEHAMALRAVPRVTILQRAFMPQDLERGLFLVIVATDDHALNRRILDACRSRGLLCACPDTGWEHGDFISPASFRHGDLTISVSTGGASCRRSRLIKESLARHAEALGQAELLVVGTDHRYADLAHLEALHLSGARLEATATMLRQVMGIHEFMLLSTCNRVELVGLATATPALLEIAQRALGLDHLDGRFYVHHGPDAFRHLALVVSGLLSRTTGETHVCAQVKDALERSRHAGWSAGVLQDWVGRALHVGKDIRHATQAMLGATDVEDLTCAHLARELDGLRGRRVLVIGAGKIGCGVIERLVADGALATCCYHKNVPVFAGPAADAVQLVPLDGLSAALPNQAAIVCAAAVSEPILTAAHSRLMAAGQGMVVIDLGMPRNVASDFGQAQAALRVVSAHDLRRDGHASDADVQQALDTGARIVAQHMGDYERIKAGI